MRLFEASNSESCLVQSSLPNAVSWKVINRGNKTPQTKGKPGTRNLEVNVSRKSTSVRKRLMSTAASIIPKMHSSLDLPARRASKQEQKAITIEPNEKRRYAAFGLWPCTCEANPTRHGTAATSARRAVTKAILAVNDQLARESEDALIVDCCSASPSSGDGCSGGCLFLGARFLDEGSIRVSSSLITTSRGLRCRGRSRLSPLGNCVPISLNSTGLDLTDSQLEVVSARQSLLEPFAAATEIDLLCFLLPLLEGVMDVGWVVAFFLALVAPSDGVPGDEEDEIDSETVALVVVWNGFIDSLRRSRLLGSVR